MNIQKKPKRIRRKEGFEPNKKCTENFYVEKNKIWSPKGFIGRSYSCGRGAAKYSLLRDVSYYSKGI